MKKVIITIATFAMIMFSSCNDFLVEPPKLGQSDVLILDTYEGLDNATGGLYAYISRSGWYGAYYVLDAEMRSGNGKINLEYSSGRGTVAYNWNYTPEATSGLWEIGYAAIAAANKIMENLEGKDIGAVTAQDLDNLKAECLFIRAIAHFDLVKLFAQSYTSTATLGVPNMTSSDPSLLPARNTVKEVYGFLVEDLLEAEKLIDPNYKRSGVSDQKAVVTLPAIQALLSRAYLFMSEWQKCADYATKVINNPSFRMWTIDEIVDVWTIDVPSAGEVIFEMYGSQGNTFDAYWEGTPWMTSFDGYGDIAASRDIVDFYDWDDDEEKEDGIWDMRRKLFKSPEEATNLFWTTKYNGKGISTPDVSNTIILRLSEMYLNRAEALANNAVIDGVSAHGDLNVIRTNRIKGAEPLTGAGRELVFSERKKELAWEGHLLFDLSRTGTRLERPDCNDAQNQTIEYPSHRWALPIPKSEIDVNPNLKQNPGYGN